MKNLISYLVLAILLVSFSHSMSNQQKLNEQFSTGNVADAGSSAKIEVRSHAAKAHLLGAIGANQVIGNRQENRIAYADR